MKRKLSSLVSIAQSLTDEVCLKRDFLDPRVNDRRLRSYIAPRGARTAIRGILEGLQPESKTRVHVISGACGTGKSHFGLVLANLISRDIDDPALSLFLRKLEQDDEQLVSLIRQTRRAVGKCLVVLPEPSWSPESFNYSLLASLAEALRTEGIDYDPPAVFLAALDSINTWMMTDAEVYRRFEDACLRQGKTPEMVSDELARYKTSGYGLFKELHREVMHGAPFIPQLTADPAQVYNQTIKHLRSTSQWQGVFIFYDDFARYLSHMAEDPGSFETQQLQSFVTYCKGSGHNQCHLVAIAHQTLDDYAGNMRSPEEWSELCSEFTSADHQLAAVGGEHEMEEIIGAILVQQKAGDTWKRVAAHAEVSVLTDLVQDRGLYPDQNRSWIRSRLVQGCYPLHPYATFCLLWLANSVVQQRERTLFALLGDPSENGLQGFMDKNTVLQSDNRLNLYTVDRLYDYYKGQIHAHTDYGYIVDAVDNASALVRRNTLATRALKVIAVLSVVNHPLLPTTERTILEALHVSSGQKDLAQALADLVERGYLRCRPITKRYELPGRPGTIDAGQAVRKARQTIIDDGFDLKDYLNTNHALPAVEALDYSAKHFTRRYAACLFIGVLDLSSPEKYVERIQSWYVPDRAKHEGDALVTYVVATTPEDISNAEHLVSQDICKHPQLVVAIPKTPARFGETALEWTAVQAVRQRGLKTDEGEVDSEEFEILEASVREDMVNGLRDFLHASNLTWHRDGNVVTDMPQGGEEKFISEVLEEIFPKTPYINDETIANPISTTDRSKKHRWTAMNVLLQTEGPIQLSKKGCPASERILRSCLRDVGLLERVSDRDNIEEFEMRDEAPENSAAREIWEFLNTQALARGGKVTPATELVIPLIEPPYGLTNQALELFLAAFLRTRREDTVVFNNFEKAKREHNPDSLNECLPLSGEDVANLVRNPSDFVVYYYEVPPTQRAYVNGIIRLTAVDEETLTDFAGWDRARHALLAWYRKLPAVTRTASDLENQQCRPLLDVLANLEKTGHAREIIQRQIPAALGFDADTTDLGDHAVCEQILDSLRRAIAEMDVYAGARASRLLAAIGAMFGAETEHQEEAALAMQRWYRALTEVQRMHPFRGDEGHLIEAAREGTPIIERMLNRLPERMRLKPFMEWEADRSATYLARLRSAKQSIENWRPEVDPKGSNTHEKQILHARTQIDALLKELDLPVSIQRELLSALLEELGEGQ